MKRLLIPAVLGLSLATIAAGSARAGGRHSGAVNTPYGQFNAAEMAQAGGDPTVAMQFREQKQMMQYEQQMFKQQQLFMQQQAKQQEFLKKHPEAAKSFTQPVRTATKKTASKTAKKDKAKAATTDTAAPKAKPAS